MRRAHEREREGEWVANFDKVHEIQGLFVLTAALTWCVRAKEEVREARRERERPSKFMPAISREVGGG